MYLAHGAASYIVNEAVQKKRISKLNDHEQLIVAILSILFGIFPDIDLVILPLISTPSFTHHSTFTHGILFFLSLWLLLNILFFVLKKMLNKKGRKILNDELLNVTDDVNKDFYYDKIITTIIETGIAENFIASLCLLIRSLAIDRLHIIGDIYDRGPRADIIMDELISMLDVDVQWGNHDISWMGAASGNRALIANVIRISMHYNNFDILEDGYGLNLRALAIFANERSTAYNN